MHFLSVLALFLLLQSDCVTSCTHNQYYWITRDSLPWPVLEGGVSPMNLSMCGNQWYDLMQWNASQVTTPDARHWLLCFHQLCAATLNQQVDVLAPHQVSLAILVLRDSMERSCDNVEGWATQAQQNNATRQAVETLIFYNSEATCPSEQKRALFSFVTSPELFVVDYNATGPAMRDLVYHIGRMTAIFTGYTVVMIVLLLVLCVLWYVVVRNKRREYEFYANGPGSVSVQSYRNEKRQSGDDVSEQMTSLDDNFRADESAERARIRLAQETAKTK